MAEPFVFQPGQQTVDLSALVKKTAQTSFVAFKELCDISSDSSDTEKKIGLLKFINKTRQRLLRLLVLSKWCYQIPLVECCQQLVGTLSNHDNSIVQAADSLFFLHDGLQQARAPMYDIPSAVEVLLTGSYKRLPKCIEDLGMQPMLAGDEKESTLQKLDTMLRSRLLDIPLPREITSVKVAKGMVTLLVEEEFEAQLTLGYRGYPLLWRVLHLKVLVGEHSGTLKLTAMQESSLKDDLERRMAALDDPFQILYSVLHEFCSAWVMNTIIRQVRALQKGRWKDAIRFELIQEGSTGNSAQNAGHGLGIEIDGEADGGKAHVSPGLKILYWLDLVKGTDTSSLPSLRIEQQSDHHISCSHVPPVIDGVTNYEAHFHINLTSIDVERLLLRAILCNVHTRLLELYRLFRNSSRLCRVDSDVILHTTKTISGIDDAFTTEDVLRHYDGEVGEEVLCVRAYGKSYVALGINIRSGKFVLRSHSTSISPALLADAEDSLNQGLLSPLDIFISLRNRSLLQLYADIGVSINLKVFEKGTLRLKPPTEGPRIGADTLILAFPDCCMSFFLMLQMNSDFMPILTLIEGQPQQNSMLSGPVRFVRYKNLDVGSLLVKEDEFSVSNWVHPSNAIIKATNDVNKQKRKSSDSLLSLPSLQGVKRSPVSKRRKVGTEGFIQPIESFTVTSSDGSGLSNAPQISVGQEYSQLIAAANEGKAPLFSYTAFLLQVSRECSSSIKMARLCSQMDALNISYLEEVGLQKSSNELCFRLQSFRVGLSPRSRDLCGWEHICLCLGNPGSPAWSVRLKQKSFPQSTAAAQVIACEFDSHICCTSDGLVLNYYSIEDDSIRNMMVDLNRLWNNRAFALEMRWLLENKVDEKGELGQDRIPSSHRKGLLGGGGEGEKSWEVMRRAFRVEAIGLTSVWFSYVGSFIARFVVEWEKGKIGCTLHVSPDQLWPHTKYLEDFINGGEVHLLLDCIRVTAGPLHALAGAIRPARMPVATTPITSAANLVLAGSARAIQAVGQVLSPTAPLVTSPSNNNGRVSSAALPGSSNNVPMSSTQGSQNGEIASGHGRGTGLVPSSLLPTDVSVVLRSPFWIRIVYRRQFAVDMRCFAGDQVWLQPAPPPRGVGLGSKGSLPCPQFRPFVMEQITTGYGSMDASPMAGAAVLSAQSSQGGSLGIAGNSVQSLMQGMPSRVNANTVGVARSGLGSGNPQAPSLLRVGTPGNLLNSQGLVPLSSMAPGRSIVPGVSMGFHPSHRESNAAGYTFSDDGGYGGVWVPLAFLRKVLRGTLRYLGVVWLFAQFPDIIKEVLASHLKENEGSLLNHDPETPALRFYVQNCVFAVSVHRQQLVLQAINVKRFQHQPQPQSQAQSQQQQQQSQTSQQPSAGSDSDLSPGEMQEIGDFFARRAAFEPYDASRLASFVTMLTLPVPVLREFICLIAWKRDAAKAAQHLQSTDSNLIPRPKIELCLENRSGQSHGSGQEDNTLLHASGGGTSSPKSSIDYDRARKIVDFTLTVIFDPIHVPHINVAGGAGWLPQCVAIRLRYAFGESSSILLLHMEGSHGGRACWSRVEDWERCKERIARALEVSGSGNATDGQGGRLRAVAEAIQTTLQSALQQLRKGSANVLSPTGSSL
ncbi:hypothetical protein GOP47_0022721 [Adiantum capillus-veneris]|uniref:Mediator of RNA polymerase II transcription subunit 14 n=1 Tax=Adiantum capillus-veneris TaxID=13818 RepID=A0A9D4Z6A0_ADICA|nr:hypothetical protein GOP47_0022721 [Adiantum capillus-veneris]